MTGHQINSLVGDLVAMAQAMEKLPIAEQRIHELERHVDHANETIQARELSIIDYKAEIDKLYAFIRELEVAKDSAETMFLEADDRTTRALEFVKTMFGSAGSLIQALEPPKPEPVVEVQPPLEGATSHPVSAEATTGLQSANEGPAAHGIGDILPQGQSEPDPTAALTEVPSANTASHTESVEHGPVQASSSDKPYADRRYYDVPTYVSYHEWIAGGGTDVDYHWRPAF